MSSHKRIFINWAQIVSHDKNLFDQLNQAITEKVKYPLFGSLQEYQKRIQAMKKLIANYQRLRKEFWVMWHQKVGSMRLKEQTVYESIRSLQDQIDEKRKKQMNKSLKNFDVERKLYKTTYNLYKKLGQTSNEMVQQLFLKWKYLPIRAPKDISHQFQEGLARFANNRNRIFLDFLKLNNKNANRLKKNVVGQLILRKNAQLKSVFDLWNYNQQNVAVERCYKTEKLFEIIQQKLVQQFSVVAESRRQRVENAINILINRTMKAPQQSFNHWREIAANEKRIESWSKLNKFFENIENKIKQNLEQSIIEKAGSSLHNQKVQKLVLLFERLQGLYKRTLNNSMHMIQKKSSGVILRAYFASLWKWKFANLDAKYYMKYKQIYRQSAIISRFVQIAQSKVTNTLNQGFVGIKDPKNKYYKLMGCIRTREREAIKLMASYLNIWRQNMIEERYTQNMQDLMTVLTQQKLNRVLQIFNQYLLKTSLNRLKIILLKFNKLTVQIMADFLQQNTQQNIGYIFTTQSKRGKQMSNFLLMLHEKGQSSIKRQLQVGFDSIKARDMVIKRQLLIKGLIKLLDTDSSFKQRHYQFAFDAIYASAYVSNINEWEKRTFQYMVGLTDLNLSFNILKSLAYPEQKPVIQFPSNPAQMSQNYGQASISRYNQQIYTPRMNQMQQSYSQQLQIPSRSQGSQQYRMSTSPSIIVAHQLNSSESDDSIIRSKIINQSPTIIKILKESQDDDGSIGGIMNRIGQENLQVLNSLGAADHIYSILKIVFFRQKASAFKIIRCKYLN